MMPGTSLDDRVKIHKLFFFLAILFIMFVFLILSLFFEPLTSILEFIIFNWLLVVIVVVIFLLLLKVFFGKRKTHTTF